MGSRAKFENLVFDVTDYGLRAEGATFDNADALEALIAGKPEGSAFWFPAVGTSWYGFGRQVVVDKSVSFVGPSWGRGTINGPLTGSVLRFTTTAAHLAAPSLFKVTKSRVTFEGLALVGKPTRESAATVTVNGTVMQLSSITATPAFVGARVEGPYVPAGTTVSSVDTGANRVTISKACAGTAITGATSTSSALTITFKGPHDLAPGSSITLTGFSPSAWNGTWDVAAVPDFRTVTIASTANPGAATTLGAYTAPLAGSTVWFGADGVIFDGAAGEHAHECKMTKVKVEQFSEGLVFGVADHFSAIDCELGGNYDSVCYLPTNENDFMFINTLLSGNVRSSQRLAVGASVTKVLAVGSHHGFSQFGIFQDVSTTGQGYASLNLVGSPIEYVSKGHVRIACGGNMTFDAGSYWTWTNGTPATPPFIIYDQQNIGPIRFEPHLYGSNPNAPYLAYIGAQAPGCLFDFNANLGTFAAAAFPFNTYGSKDFRGQVFFNGPISTGGTSAFTAGGAVRLNNRLQVHSVGRTSAYATSNTTDLWVKCSGTWTLTLSSGANAEQVVIATNTSSGTITVAASSGSILGTGTPTTLTPGQTRMYLYDGTNWFAM
ncbi:hypothetical protein GGQ22_12265 [Nocardioides sp. zg-579]|uniref:Uncharacterized protein n=1 Tax=Nocardioides marmotae TaxID=2663857 RepID=A0A6I3JCP6_9ACTN|nr:hypothetical protein [Nocardioides marmotae]MCR6032208.1 hypothetical protein [Gordonia jinghuaiqii]MTB95855.1 hypothetical protein [Nocardioides marmotae]QKE02795.1 hypothetical protein HPC71_18270 [Nocardioides marmotae]